MREAQYQSRLIRELKDAGAMVLNLTPNAFSGLSWPDLHVVHRTWTGWLELKGPRTKTTAGQWIKIGDLRARGTSAWHLRFLPDGSGELRAREGMEPLVVTDELLSNGTLFLRHMVALEGRT